MCSCPLCCVRWVAAIGAALSVKEVSGKPIKFVGTGEKLEALEQFYPDRMAQRILGKRRHLAKPLARVLDWLLQSIARPTTVIQA